MMHRFSRIGWVLGVGLSFAALSGCGKTVNHEGHLFAITEPGENPVPGYPNPDPEQCEASPFGQQIDMSVFAKTKSVIFDSEAESRIAAGEFLDLMSVNAGTKETPDAERAHVVGGRTLIYKGGRVPNGRVTWKTSVFARGLKTLGGINKGDPVDFKGFGERLDAMSSYYASVEATGTAEVDCGKGAGTTCVLHLTGTDPVWNAFTVEPKDIRRVKHVNVSVPPGATALVNVRGRTLVLNGTRFHLASGVLASRVLWNFPENETLGLANLKLPGAVVAPKSAVAMTDVEVEGGVFAHCAGGTCLRFKKSWFDGCLPRMD